MAEGRKRFPALCLLTALLLLWASPLPGDDSTAIFKLVNQNKADEVRTLLEKDPGLSGVRSKGRMTPLHIAAAKGHIEIVRILLDSGADVNARTVNATTPLAFAVVNDHGEIAELLREAGGIE